MTTLCCSKAILAELGLGADSFPPPDFSARLPLFGNWFAHLVLIERKKCLIFVNGNTLLSFLIAGVKGEDLDRLPALFTTGLRRMLEKERVTSELADAVIAAHGEITVGVRTRYDWQVIDSLEDLVLSYRAFAGEGGGLEGEGLDQIISRANQIPRNVNGAKNSFKAWLRLMKQLPMAGRLSAQRTFMADLRRDLSSSRGKEATIDYISVIPEIFTSYADFIQACRENDLECVTPDEILQTPADRRLYVRLHTLLSRLGIPMPGRN